MQNICLKRSQLQAEYRSTMDAGSVTYCNQSYYESEVEVAYLREAPDGIDDGEAEEVCQQPPSQEKLIDDEMFKLWTTQMRNLKKSPGSRMEGPVSGQEGPGSGKKGSKSGQEGPGSRKEGVGSGKKGPKSGKEGPRTRKQEQESRRTKIRENFSTSGRGKCPVHRGVDNSGTPSPFRNALHIMLLRQNSEWEEIPKREEEYENMEHRYSLEPTDDEPSSFCYKCW